MMLYHCSHQNLELLVSFLIQPVSIMPCHILSITFDIMFIDPTFALLPPCNCDHISCPLIEKIIACLSTCFDLLMQEIHPHLQMASLKQYGKVQCLDNGDVINASTLVAVGDDH